MADSRRIALAALGIAVVAVIGLAFNVPHGGPCAADLLDPAIRGATQALSPLAAALNTLSQLPIWAVLVLAQAVAIVRRRPELALEVVLVSAAAEAISAGVRLLVDRPRPELAQATDLVIAAGFPSGHVARTVVLVATAFVVLPWLRRHRRAWLAGGIALVALMAEARVSVSAHYASDVLGGALLGAGVVAGWSLLTRVRRLEAGPSPSNPAAPADPSARRPAR